MPVCKFERLVPAAIAHLAVGPLNNMGAAYFIVLERKIDGLDTGMDGKAIARHADALEQAARELGVRPLSEFISIAPDQAAEFMEGEGIDASELELPPLQQFTAEEGLATVRGLVAHPIAQTDGVAQDLQECKRILNAAAQQGLGWHFEVDF